MANMLLMRKVLEDVENGREVATVTITASKGSAPRGVGTMMRVLDDGSTYGTIGGGALEKRAIDLSLEAIDKGESRSVSFPLDTKEVDMICGGEVELFIQVYKNKPKLLIAGGGHVGYAIYNLASLLDFHIVVFEDREEFLTKERFPKAHELILGDIEKGLKEYPIDKDTYIIIVTRGHKYDEKSLESIINSNANYIGVMGSKRKVGTMMENLKEKGIDEENCNKVYAPIGLKISGESPEEIAVSIIAELLLIKNQGELIHIKDSLKL